MTRRDRRFAAWHIQRIIDRAAYPHEPREIPERERRNDR